MPSKDKAWAVVIGLGLALLPVHNEWLTSLIANSEGESIIFLPVLGWLLVALGTALFIVGNWQRVRQAGLGARCVWIPLAVIVGAMAVSGVVNGGTLQEKVSPLFMGMALFAVYLAARILGKDVFKMLAPFVVIGSVSIIVSGIVSPGQYTGGFITNYCASAGYLIFGVLVYRGRWRFTLIGLAAVGLFLIGALEAVFIMAVLGLVVLARRDFSRVLLTGAVAIVVLVVVWAALGFLGPLYEGNNNLEVLGAVVRGDVPINEETATALSSGRWLPIVEAVRSFSLIGHGYSLSTVGGSIVHNMPLIIMHQIGPFAGVAWLCVSIYCLVRTKWKYAWVAILAMGVWDHYLWTQMAPFWWALIGVTTVSGLKSDLIFRQEVRI